MIELFKFNYTVQKNLFIYIYIYYVIYNYICIFYYNSIFVFLFFFLDFKQNDGWIIIVNSIGTVCE